MARYFIILILLILATALHGQSPVGAWSDHLSYNSVENIAIGNKEIYASTGYSIMIYNKEFDELRKLTRVQGLSETGISAIAFSTDYNILIISYNLSLIHI